MEIPIHQSKNDSDLRRVSLSQLIRSGNVWLLNSRGRTLAVAVILAITMVLGFSSTVQASHFRYGNITWKQTTGRTIEFKISVGYRRSYFGALNVGSTFAESNINFGDGNSVRPTFTVTTVNVAEDYFFAETTVSHTYAANGNFNAYYTDCCRLSSLQNNADADYYVPAVVNVGTTNNSPVSTLTPIVNLPAGQSAASFQIPASDPNADPLTFSLAVASDLGGNAFAQPAGLSVSSSGLVTFNTVGKTDGQLYSVVVKLSDGKAYNTVDFLIKITANTGNPPVFVYGGITPANGSTIQALVSCPVSFSVRATDPDAGNTITLQAVGLPAGATFPSVTSTSPVTSQFNFTPTVAGTSVINFSATDNTNNQALSSVTIQANQAALNSSGSISCNGGSATLTATAITGATYSFAGPNGVVASTGNTASVSQPGAYTVTITVNGCSATAQTTVSGSSGLPQISLTNDGPLSCTGGSVTLTATPISGATYSFAGPNGVIASTGNTASVSQPGTYTVTVTDNGCSGTAQSTVGGGTGGQFALVAPTYDCATGAFRFNTICGDGTPIEYYCVPGITGWTTNPNQFVDQEIRTASDAPVMTLRARQSGVEVTYQFDLRATCPVDRPGNPTKANQSPGLLVPIPDQTATQGQAFNYTFPANTFRDPDGDVMTYTIAGQPATITLSDRTLSGTPTSSGIFSVSITASDYSGLSSTSVFKLTVNPVGPQPTGFAITGVTTTSCDVLSPGQRRLTFSPQYSGVNGQPITFAVVNETMPTTAPAPYVLNLYTDNPSVTLRASQAGSAGQSTFTYNWLAACGGARKGAPETVEGAGLQVSATPNPVSEGRLRMIIRGVEGKAVQIGLINLSGHTVQAQNLMASSGEDIVEWNVTHHASGVYVLRVTAENKSVSLKIIK